MLFPRSGKGKIDDHKAGDADGFGADRIVFRHVQLDGGAGQQFHRIIDIGLAEVGSDKNCQRIGPEGERDHPGSRFGKIQIFYGGILNLTAAMAQIARYLYPEV